jgi:hypothetical protein
MEMTGCKACKKTKMKKTKVGIVILGFYLIIASIYGTIEFIKTIIDLFK